MEKSEKNVSKFAYRFKESFNSISSNKAGNILAVGGRGILKILDINYDGERFRTRRSFNHNSNYIEWCPLEGPNGRDSKFACTTTGFVILYDVNIGSGGKETLKLDMKSQSTLRMNWHPTDPNSLVATSNEWNIKVWDTRNDKKPQALLRTSDVIRDVKYVPTNPNLVLVALDNGGLSLHDIRKPEDIYEENREAHKNIALTLDFNPINPEIFASGSMDKVIKIWNINNIKKETMKILNQQGVGCLKWRSDNVNKLCSSSITKDPTLILWDLRSPKYPESILRGNKDVVSSFVLEPTNKYAITCSKDGMVICHDWKGAYQPMQYANKYGMSVDLDSTCAFIFNNELPPEENKKPERNIYFVSDLNLFSASNFTTLKEEVKYLMDNYKMTDVPNVWENNAQVTKESKRMVSGIWKDIPVAMKDLSSEKEPTGINLDHFLKGGRQNPELSGTALIKNSTAGASENKSFFNPSDVANLVSYYEKNPEQFKTDMKEKRIVVKNGKFFCQPQVRQLAEEYQKEQMKLNEAKTLNSKKYRKSVEDSILKTVQEVVNNGDLQSGYYMYLLLKEVIKFPDHMVQTWAQAYIELLRNYRFYQGANEILSTCPVEKISKVNARSTTFYAKCGNCKKSVEDEGRIVCGECKKFISECSICKVPVKGLMLWCQGCGHGGHFKEVKKWFEEHDECPSGCQHKCYAKKN